jgi:hypothetical protein
MRKVGILLIISFIINLGFLGRSYARNVLLNFDNGNGEILENWDWNDDIAYGQKGWTLNTDPNIGFGQSYLNGWGPRSFDKTDYGKNNSVEISKIGRSPSTPDTGGSLHFFSSPQAIDNRSTWWVWYDGKPLSDIGITSANTNRMSLYLKLDNTPKVNDQFNNFPIATAEIGTYLCWVDNSIPNPGSGQGKGCPYEGPGNQHYYHWLSPNPGAWIHVLVDQSPQHLRGIGLPPGDNPSFITNGKNYFEQINQFYIQQSQDSSQPTGVWVDDIEFYSTSETLEPNQNEESINTLWVGYWSTTDTWEIGFNDNTADGDIKKTYEIRWSTSEITNANWVGANSITPLFFGGLESTGHKNLISRPQGTKRVAWTSFKLPDNVEIKGDQLYFAVKDVADINGNKGTVYPWNKNDDVNAANDFVKVIDYIVGNSSPNPPSSLLVN